MSRPVDNQKASHLHWMWFSVEYGPRLQKHIAMPTKPAPIAKRLLTVTRTIQVSSIPSKVLELLSEMVSEIGGRSALGFRRTNE